MPATIIETYRSREGSEGNRADSELRYIVRGTDDDVEVRTLLFATSPPFYLGLRRSDVNFVPVGAGIWECSVRYENQESRSIPSTLAVERSMFHKVSIP